jgi:hypothetical protein
VDKAIAANLTSETVENYVELAKKAIEPAAIGVITGWVYLKIGGVFKSRDAFLFHIEKVLVPPIVTMTMIASNGGLVQTLIKSLLTSQLLTLMAFIELDEFINDDGERRFKLSVMDRLFLAMWIPLIYFILIRGGQSTSGGGLALPFP